MRITSISWFILLVIAELSVIASSGAVLYDALALLLVGHALIAVRTGQHCVEPISDLSPWRQFLEMELACVRNVKLGGVLLVLATGILVLPFSWLQLAKLSASVLAIELLAGLLLECCLRSRAIGNMAILIAVALCFWSIHFCANALVEHMMKVDLPEMMAFSWTNALGHIEGIVALLLGGGLGLLGILHGIRYRHAHLAKPRLFLFA